MGHISHLRTILPEQESLLGEPAFIPPAGVVMVNYCLCFGLALITAPKPGVLDE